MKVSLKSSYRGFTVVELVVVVALTVILAAIGYVSYQRVVVSGDGAKVQTGYSDIRNAVELFESQRGFYPECMPGPECGFGSDVLPNLSVNGLERFNYVGDPILYRQDNTPGPTYGWGVLLYSPERDRTCKMLHGGDSSWFSSATPICWE